MNHLLSSHKIAFRFSLGSFGETYYTVPVACDIRSSPEHFDRPGKVLWDSNKLIIMFAFFEYQGNQLCLDFAVISQILQQLLDLLQHFIMPEIQVILWWHQNKTNNYPMCSNILFCYQLKLHQLNDEHLQSVGVQISAQRH